MKFYFGYIYYRMYKAFFRWDGVIAYRAIIGITMIQTLLITEAIMIILYIFFSPEQLKPYGKIIAGLAVVIGIVMGVFNDRKYRDKFYEFDKQWKDDSNIKKTLKGLLVILSLIAPWIFLFLIGHFIGIRS